MAELGVLTLEDGALHLKAHVTDRHDGAFEVRIQLFAGIFLAADPLRAVLYATERMLRNPKIPYWTVEARESLHLANMYEVTARPSAHPA